MEPSVLQVYLDVIGRISQPLPQAQLLQVCQHLDIPGFEIIDGKTDSPQTLVRKITRHLTREEVDEMEDQGMSIFTELREFLAQLTETPAIPKPDMEAARVLTPSGQAPAEMTPTLTPTSLMTLTRRDFKISGQIGEPGQKDKLSFSSLAHQIESGRLKGHMEQDLIEGVIRAVLPGSPLRSYLEGRVGLTLPMLRHILRSHYQEKDATELYHQLTRLTQQSRESPQAFLVRALDLRQKVVFASQETGSGLKYDPVLVKSMFLHALLTGLRSDAIKAELRPYLQNPDTTDEELFEKVNLVASQEAQRQEKLGRPGSRAIAVNEIQQDLEGQQSQEVRQKEKPRQGTLMSDIADLKAGIAEIASLKSQINSLQETLTSSSNSRQSSQRPTSDARRRRGCYACQQSGNGDHCDHCFKCGSSEHFARGCRRGRSGNASGNDQGLLPRDAQ